MHKETKLRRKLKVRAQVASATLPRLSVHRTNKHIYAQIIDHKTGKVLAAASDLLVKADKVIKTEKAQAVGKELAEKAKKAKITAVVFDRAGFRYHGRVKAIAEGARQGGLKF